jgi:hypothetical protein
MQQQKFIFLGNGMQLPILLTPLNLLLWLVVAVLVALFEEGEVVQVATVLLLLENLLVVVHQRKQF